MVPIILDAARLPIALVGRGHELAKRAAWLQAGGAERLAIYSDDPAASTLLAAQAPGMVDRLTGRLPTAPELAAVKVVWITGIEDAQAEVIAAPARAANVLVNIEDVLASCDFHTPAVVRRGDLLLTVSTGGRSPGLAQRIRGWLEEQFQDDWAERLAGVARKRDAWRRRPRTITELATLTTAMIDAKGWLPERRA